jgi:hypothetical protein
VVAVAAVEAEAVEAGAAVPGNLNNLPRLKERLQRRRLNRQLRNQEEAVAGSAAAGADPVSLPVNITSKFQPPARTLLQPYASRKIREFRFRKPTALSGPTQS